ncbi:MAG TPA: zinc ABC transporter substrate-binding protein [Fibrobacteraceae bacterium]|jgi:zinc transport system substrate-binding protein|nr:zinc ABC transporter substrate-binding protein [Fibrobacteraceae bacterium]
MNPFYLAIVLLCAFGSVASASKLNVAVTLQPYAKIVEEIGGDRVSVISMIPPNADPHSYEPKPGVLKTFSKADLYLSDSSGLDQVWLPRFLSVNKKIEMVYISSGVSWMQESEDHHHGHHHDHHHHGEDHHENKHKHEENASLDPHLWTSPKQVIKLAENVLSALIKKDAASKSYYESRYQLFIEKWTSIDQFIEKTVSQIPEKRRIFIVFHPSYGYLARDYDLIQRAIEVEGKEPKPQDLKALILEAQKNDIRAIFVQPQFSKRSAESIAKQLNAVVVSTDPLAYDIEKNLRNFIQALLEASKK